MSTYIALRRRVGNAVLGIDPVRRRRVGRTLLAASVYLASIVTEGLGLLLGFGDPAEVGALIAFLFIGAVAFYPLVRSGWSERLADPMMTVPQVVFAMSAVLGAYPVNGAGRGLNLLLISVPPLFGFVALGRRAALATVAAIPVAFAPMMATLAARDPVHFPPRVEVVHFLILVVCGCAMAALLAQILSLRDRVRSQKAALSEATERIAALAVRDELTRLFNRRHLRTRLDAEVSRRARGGPPFCVCLIDIDFFKRINDVHGHATGDAVLRRFARMLEAGAREGDVVGRWGGEEFLLLMPATTAAVGRAHLEGLRALGADAGSPAAETVPDVRFSAGLAEDEGDAAGDILERADRALYAAKAGGRDRIVVADAPLPG